MTTNQTPFGPPTRRVPSQVVEGNRLDALNATTAVNSRVDELKAQTGRQIVQLQARIDELNRKSKGITRANGEVARVNQAIARIELQLTQLKAALESGTGRLQRLGDAASDAQVETVERDLQGRSAAMLLRMDESDRQLAELTQRVDDHDVVLVEHGTNIETLQARTAGHGQRLDGVETSTIELRRRTDDIQSELSGGSIAIPLAFGLLAGAAYWFFTKDKYSSDLEHWIGSIGIGGIVAAIIGLVMNAARKRSESSETRESTTETRTQATTQEARPSRRHWLRDQYNKHFGDNDEAERPVQTTPTTTPAPVAGDPDAANSGAPVSGTRAPEPAPASS